MSALRTRADADERRLHALLPLARKLVEICACEHGSGLELAEVIQDYAGRLHEASEEWERDHRSHEASGCDPEVCDWCADEDSEPLGPEPTLSASQRNAGASL